MTESGYSKVDDAQPVQQIWTKAIATDFLIQIAIRGGYELEFDPSSLDVPHTTNSRS